MKFYRDHFGKKLKDALKNAGMKQFQLAEIIDVEPPTVSRWINGIDFPSDKYLPLICEALNVDVDFFGYDSSGMSAIELLDILQKNKDTLFLLPKIPKDILTLLSKQDEIYFDHLRKTLEGLEERRLQKKNQKKTTA